MVPSPEARWRQARRGRQSPNACLVFPRLEPSAAADPERAASRGARQREPDTAWGPNRRVERRRPGPASQIRAREPRGREDPSRHETDRRRSAERPVSNSCSLGAIWHRAKVRQSGREPPDEPSHPGRPHPRLGRRFPRRSSFPHGSDPSREADHGSATGRLPQAAWVARQLELGNIEVRVSPGYPVSPSPGSPRPVHSSTDRPWLEERGSSSPRAVTRDPWASSCTRGRTSTTSCSRLATGIRISTRAAELHAYLAIQRLHLYQQHAIDGVLDPAVAKALMAPFRADVARRLDAGYYATATSLSVVERGRVFLEAFRRSRMFPAGEELRRDAAREILGPVPIAR